MKQVILAALCALALAGCARAQASEAQEESSGSETLHLASDSAKMGFVRVGEVKSELDTAAASATGKVAFNEDVTSRVGSPVSGRVLELKVQVGDMVKKGQPLLTIASPDVESARADALQAEADFEVAERALDRAKRLLTEQAIAQKELQSAQDDEVRARTNLTRARARLAVLGVSEKDFGAHYVLRSPIDGTVVSRDILPGQEVRSDQGTPLLTVADLRTLWVEASVYERDISRVQAGDSAEVWVPAYPAQVWTGTVKHVGEVVDPQTRTVKVLIAVPNPDGRLKPEMFAHVKLSARQGTPVLSIPAAAVLSDGEHDRVIVADAHGNFRDREVQIGPEHGGRVQVLGGLAAGEKIVVEGALFVQNELDAH